MQQLNGIQFPKAQTGDRSTQIFGQSVFSKGIGELDPVMGGAVLNVKSWRFGYTKHVVAQAALSAVNSEAAIKLASASLDYIHDNFSFIRDGTEMSMREAMNNDELVKKSAFYTGKIVGKGSRAEEIVVPYKGHILYGAEIIEQAHKWANKGTIEQSTAEAIEYVVKNSKCADLTNHYFVLLGATSAMGPIQVLLSLGANIIAIDLNRSHIWEKLITMTERSSGTIIFPMSRPQNECTSNVELYQSAGCNLLCDTPEIARWIEKQFENQSLTIGCYAYLDGEAHVRVAIAMDAIVERVCATRPDTSIAFLNTPTQVFIVPEETALTALKTYQKISLFSMVMKLMNLFSRGKFCVRNFINPIQLDNGSQRYLIDGLVIEQGSNYALAKCLQHWRAVVSHSNGHLVSSNVAPSTATLSVISNNSFAWAYGGMQHFYPMEIFAQETSNAVMGILLLNDLFNPESFSNPKNRISHPWQLFAQNAFHGGVWRMAYKMSSIGVPAVLLYFVRKFLPYLIYTLLGGFLIFYFMM